MEQTIAGSNPDGAPMTVTLSLGVESIEFEENDSEDDFPIFLAFNPIWAIHKTAIIFSCYQRFHQVLG